MKYIYGRGFQESDWECQGISMFVYVLLTQAVLSCKDV